MKRSCGCNVLKCFDCSYAVKFSCKGHGGQTIIENRPRK